jgi:hypothetical protein
MNRRLRHAPGGHWRLRRLFIIPAARLPLPWHVEVAR